MRSPRRPRPWYTCGCGVRWRSVSAAHCAAAGCHRTFSSAHQFDTHRLGGRCLTEVELTERGFTVNEHGYLRVARPPGENLPAELAAKLSRIV